MADGQLSQGDNRKVDALLKQLQAFEERLVQFRIKDASDGVEFQRLVQDFNGMAQRMEQLQIRIDVGNGKPSMVQQIRDQEGRIKRLEDSFQRHLDAIENDRRDRLKFEREMKVKVAAGLLGLAAMALKTFGPAMVGSG